MFHRCYSNCRPQNSARYNRIICQTGRKHVIPWEVVMHIARVWERLPRSQIQFRISRSLRPRNPANLGSEIRFWIRLKEHYQHTLSDPRLTFLRLTDLINRGGRLTVVCSARAVGRSVVRLPIPWSIHRCHRLTEVYKHVRSSGTSKAFTIFT